MASTVTEVTSARHGSPRERISRAVWLVSGLALSAAVSASTAAGGVRYDHPSQRIENTIPGSAVPPLLNLPLTNEVPPLNIENVRLERRVGTTLAAETSPSMFLKFEISNEGSTSVSDIVLEISIVEKPQSEQPNFAPRVVVHPFTIRGNVVLRPGYTMNYEMLMKNLSSECSCVATVAVVSVRSLPDSGARR
jgi:hypothetical protein